MHTDAAAPYRITEDEWAEAFTAVCEGRATDLHRCVRCLPAAARFAPDAEQVAPLRGVTRTFNGGGSDPSMVMDLTCGHQAF